MKPPITTIVMFLISISSFSQNWLTDFEEAKLAASKENKIIVLVFQGSDWCGPCMKLDNEVWNTDEFKELASSKFIMLKADFPKRKKNALNKEQQVHNNQLAERYNKQGYFPLAVVLDKDGIVKGKLGYQKLSPTSYFNKLMSF